MDFFHYLVLTCISLSLHKYDQTVLTHVGEFNAPERLANDFYMTRDFEYESWDQGFQQQVV